FGDETTNNLYDDQWHHVVWRLDNLATNATSAGGGPSAKNPFSLWIDGQEIGLSYSGSLGSDVFFNDFNNPFWIGGAGRDAVIIPNSFDGQFDEFAIYDYLLTDAQIQQHYQLATVPEPSS